MYGLPQSGTVKKIHTGCDESTFRCGGGYGNYVIIDHGNDMSTLYAHLGSINVKVGDKVTQGDTIGKMGRSGTSTEAKGISLHFEVRDKYAKVNPQNYF